MNMISKIKAQKIVVGGVENFISCDGPIVVASDDGLNVVAIRHLNGMDAQLVLR